MHDDETPATAPQFAITDSGYDVEQVDKFVTELQRRLDEARQQLELAEADHARAFDGLYRRIRELEEGQSGTDSYERTDPDFRALGDRIGRMLDLADAEARTLRDSATRTAEETLSRARREAEETVAIARHEAEQTLSNAHREAENTVSTARREAEERVSTARNAAEELTRLEEQKREMLQRQLQSLRDNLTAILGMLPAEFMAVAGVKAAAEAASDTVDVTPDEDMPAQIDLTAAEKPASESAAYSTGSDETDASIDDLFDDSTQVVKIVPHNRKH